MAGWGGPPSDGVVVAEAFAAAIGVRTGQAGCDDEGARRSGASGAAAMA